MRKKAAPAASATISARPAQQPEENSCRWLRHGQEAFAAMLAAIAAAQHAVRLEMFIFTPGKVGDAFRDALVAACGRGVRVRVMCDSVGSIGLSANYWNGLKEAGGEFRFFNPLHLHRFIYRDHRKILVVDEEVAFIGGINIGDEYNGDGVQSGWRDLGLSIRGPLARVLADTFNDLFARADFRHRRFQRIRHTRADAVVSGHGWKLLLTGPGRGHRALKQSLINDFEQAQAIDIMSAYFLPSLRILHTLKRAARRGAKVRLILAGKSDVWLMRVATRGLYTPLLRAGVEIYEYEPQVLHAKMVVMDDVVYAGSANLDARSLGINYEVVTRLPVPTLAAEAREIFSNDLKNCRRIELRSHRKAHTRWRAWLERWAYFAFARIDPYLARQQRRHLLKS